MLSLPHPTPGRQRTHTLAHQNEERLLGAAVWNGSDGKQEEPLDKTCRAHTLLLLQQCSYRSGKGTLYWQGEHSDTPSPSCSQKWYRPATVPRQPFCTDPGWSQLRSCPSRLCQTRRGPGCAEMPLHIWAVRSERRDRAPSPAKILTIWTCPRLFRPRGRLKKPDWVAAPGTGYVKTTQAALAHFPQASWHRREAAFWLPPSLKLSERHMPAVFANKPSLMRLRQEHSNVHYKISKLSMLASQKCRGRQTRILDTHKPPFVCVCGRQTISDLQDLPHGERESSFTYF